MENNALRILIIDDERSINEVLKEMLSFFDYEVHQAHDGESGFQSILDNPPHLVVCDIHLPVFSGYEVFEKTWQSEELVTKPGFIFISAGDFSKNFDINHPAFITFLRKPFSNTMLLEHITQYKATIS